MQPDLSFGNQRSRWELLQRCYVPILFCLIAALLILRVPIGVNLIGDEAFDFSHILNWMRNGFTSSPNLNIRQTSALLVYPLAKLYVIVAGGLDGILLYLRVWDVFIAMLASVALYDFLQRLRPSKIAALGAGIFFAFIPWEFPVPEYNDLGMYGFVAALALFGSAALILDQARSGQNLQISADFLHHNSGAFNKTLRLLRLSPMRSRQTAKVGLDERTRSNSLRARVSARLITSSICWVFAIIAYPPLILSFLVFAGSALSWLAPNIRRRIAVPYALCCVVAFAAGACLLVAVFGYERLQAMIEFSEKAGRLFDGSQKFAISADYLRRAPIFLAASLTSLVLALMYSISMSRIASFLACIAIAALVGASIMLKPALWDASNDVCLLLGLCAISLLFRKEGSTLRSSIVRIMVMTSLASGLIYSWAAGMGLLNVAYGLSLGACLLLTLIVPESYCDRSLRLAHTSLLVFVLVLASANSLFVVEGKEVGWQKDFGWPVDRQRVPSGPFMGLYTTPTQKQYIESVQAAFAEVRAPGRTITVFGYMPALYLLANMAPRALTAFDSGQSGSGAALMVANYYAQPSNQPDYVAVLPSGELGKIEKELLAKYVLLTNLQVGRFGFMLYGRPKHLGDDTSAAPGVVHRSASDLSDGIQSLSQIEFRARVVVDRVGPGRPRRFPSARSRFHQTAGEAAEVTAQGGPPERHLQR
jgi:hypothetical protein